MSWLTQHQLLRCVQRNANQATLQAFQGIHMIDDLPHAITSYPCIIIVNTQAHNTPGEHWIAAYIGKDRRGVVFDSLAMPVPLFLRRWMNTYAFSCRTNHL